MGDGISEDPNDPLMESEERELPAEEEKEEQMEEVALPVAAAAVEEDVEMADGGPKNTEL